MLVVSDRARSPLPDAFVGADSEAATRRFYTALRQEVYGGKTGLTPGELAELRAHYPVMMQPGKYPPELVATIYTERRAPAVRAILDEAGPRQAGPRVLDAGCAYGSESFLLAAAGARVLGVDRSPEKIRLARKRKPYFEGLFGRPLDVTFEAADLDDFQPDGEPLSLTWLSSVLANLRDQEAFLGQVADSTRPGGRVLVTDMNLLNPLFAWSEWRRRRGLARQSREFARHLSFWRMFWRADRRGARYFPRSDGGTGEIDDAQFFWWATLARLLRRAGLEPCRAEHSGFVPPFLRVPGQGALEKLLAQVPLLRWGGYFYLMAGIKARAVAGSGDRSRA